MADISYLMPLANGKEAREHRRNMGRILNRVVAQITAQYRHHDMLLEIYMAGVHHGSQIILRRTEALGVDADAIFEPARQSKEA